MRACASRTQPFRPSAPRRAVTLLRTHGAPTTAGSQTQSYGPGSSRASSKVGTGAVGLTRRCSGLASLAAELHSLGWAWHLAGRSGLKKGEWHRVGGHTPPAVRRPRAYRVQSQERHGNALSSNPETATSILAPWAFRHGPIMGSRTPIESPVVATPSSISARSVRGDLTVGVEACPCTGQLSPESRQRRHTSRPGRRACDHSKRQRRADSGAQPNPALQRTRFARR